MPWDRKRLMRFRAGDPEVLSEVFRENSETLARRLRAAAWRVSSFELENGVLEVFARAFEPRARAVYDGVRPYEHFLMGIARNYLLEQARTREQPSGTIGELAEQLDRALHVDPSPDLEKSLEDRQLESLIASFLQGLSEDEARLYQLRFVDELPQEDAAERLGISRIQLRRRELAVKKGLLEHLKAHGYFGDVESTGWGFTRRRTGS